MRSCGSLVLALAVAACGVGQEKDKGKAAVDKDEPKRLKAVREWVGSLRDKALMREAPVPRAIVDADEFARLWIAWGGTKEDVPKVDFDKHLVIVATNDELVIVHLLPDLTPDGDVRVVMQIDKDTPKGFSYGIVVVEKAGVKTINGKPLGAKPDPEGGATDFAEVLKRLKLIEERLERLEKQVGAGKGKP